MATAAQLAQAQQTLKDACQALGVAVTDEASYWLLGLVAGESAYGTTADWTAPNALNPAGFSASAAGGSDGNGVTGPSNNWGSVRYYRGDNLWIWHGDRGADGTPGNFRFQSYISQLEGAKGFLRVLLFSSYDKTGAVRTIVSSAGSTPRDLAAAMYANHYYTGTKGSADDRINAYAAMISSHAAAIRKALGSAPAPPAPAPPTPPAPGAAPPAPPAPGAAPPAPAPGTPSLEPPASSPSVASPGSSWIGWTAIGVILAGAWYALRGRRRR